MTRLLLAVLLLMVPLAGMTAKPEGAAKTFWIAGWVTLSAEGQVTGFDPDPLYELPEALREPARQLVSATDFEPARIDGVGRVSRSWLRAKLELEPQGDSYAVAMNDPHLGPRPRDHYFPRFGAPPTRPARFILSYRVNVEGKVEQVVVEPIDERLPNGLAKTVQDSTRAWRFEPIEVNGVPVASRIRAPMVVYRWGTDVESPVLPPLVRDPSQPGAIGQSAYSPEVQFTSRVQFQGSF